MTNSCDYEVPEWSIIDSSKITCFMTCPRQYFFKYILSWKPSSDMRNDLVFGSSWHAAMAFMLDHWDDSEYSRIVKGAFSEFLLEYRKTFSEETDDDFHPKSPYGALAALAAYIEKYNGDRFTVLHNEISGTVPISDSRFISFRVDAIVRDEENGKILLLEHKTGSRFSQSWADRWSLSIQVGTYLHVVHCLYDKNDIWGAKINAAFFYKSKPPELIRVPIRKSPISMNVWLITIKHYYRQIEGETDMLRHHWNQEASMSVMNPFPMNTESCSQYWGCRYRDFCIAYPNPMQKCSIVPSGFKIEHWDPSRDERKTKVTNVSDMETYR